MMTAQNTIQSKPALAPKPKKDYGDKLHWLAKLKSLIGFPVLPTHGEPKRTFLDGSKSLTTTRKERVMITLSKELYSLGFPPQKDWQR